MPGLNPSEKCLFVVAQIGQTKQAQELASSLGLTNVEMAILYTRKNLAMPAMMEAAVDPSIVATHRRVEIHPASNDISAIAADFDQKVYAKLLDDVKPQRLFVCSFERHYAILCGEAKNRGIPIALFEEGTAILKNTVPGYQSFQKPTIRSSLNTIYRRVWKNYPLTRYIIVPIVKTLHQAALIPWLIGKTGWEIYKTPQIQQRILSRRHKPFLSGWGEFETVYSTNPDVIAELFPSAEMREHRPRYDNANDIALARELVDAYQVDGRTAIFASQRFDLKPDVQIPMVLNLLQRVAEGNGYRVVIKMHPRESDAVVSIYRTTIERLGLSDMFVIMEGAHVPAEYLALHSACPAVIGISSSTLMYAPKAKPSLRAISIGRQLLADFAASGIRNAGTEQVRDHVSILSVIPHIEQFDPNARAIHLPRAEAAE